MSNNSAAASVSAASSERAFDSEIREGKRFSFGANWRSFLDLFDEDRLRVARESLVTYLGRDSLEGLRFVDVGCGSGLFSLAARQLGATVTSFDFDPDSVQCATQLRDRFESHPAQWRIERGSVLDNEFLRSLGTFDVVYSWGVLHHTGDMWTALANVVDLVAPGGTLYIAIYNDQGAMSRYWWHVKQLYVKWPVLRPGIVGLHAPYYFGAVPLYRWLAGRHNYRAKRGMDLYHDVIDWLGGYPFEVAKPDEILSFYRERGFSMARMKTCAGKSGCNTYVLQRAGEAAK